MEINREAEIILLLLHMYFETNLMAMPLIDFDRLCNHWQYLWFSGTKKPVESYYNQFYDHKKSRTAVLTHGERGFISLDANGALAAYHIACHPGQLHSIIVNRGEGGGRRGERRGEGREEKKKKKKRRQKKKKKGERKKKRKKI